MAKDTLVPTRQQHERRQSSTWVDQHGREFHCEIDIASQRPVSIPTPSGGWKPPIATPEKYVKPHPKSFGRFVIDYPQWKMDLLERESERTRSLVGLAEAMFGEKAPEALLRPPPSLIAKVGAQPLPIEFVLAMESGNKWALGLRRPDGTLYPQPGWVTEDLLRRWKASTRTIWGASDMHGEGLRTAKKGEFYDDEGPESEDEMDFGPPVVADDDEVAPVAPVAPQAPNPRSFPSPGQGPQLRAGRGRLATPTPVARSA
jgi:hypothetical protein